MLVRDAVHQLPADRAGEAAAVLANAFFEYPVMRYIIGPVRDRYSPRLHELMRFFVAARYCRGEPVLAVSEHERAVAVAIMTTPFQPEAPTSLAVHREKLWKELGQEARSRYESMGRCWNQFTVQEPHYHLNMIGVLKSHAGSGYGRLLLDAAHGLSHSNPESVGVSLNTEDEGNVPLYEHFGYEVVGHARVTDELETWVMFRRDEDRRQ